MKESKQKERNSRSQIIKDIWAIKSDKMLPYLEITFFLEVRTHLWRKKKMFSFVFWPLCVSLTPANHLGREKKLVKSPDNSGLKVHFHGGLLVWLDPDYSSGQVVLSGLESKQKKALECGSRSSKPHSSKTLASVPPSRFCPEFPPCLSRWWTIPWKGNVEPFFLK